MEIKTKTVPLMITVNAGTREEEVYVAKDGIEFDNAEKCRKHEQLLEKEEKKKQIIEKYHIKTISFSFLDNKDYEVWSLSNIGKLPSTAEFSTFYDSAKISTYTIGDIKNTLTVLCYVEFDFNHEYPDVVHITSYESFLEDVKKLKQIVEA